MSELKATHSFLIRVNIHLIIYTAELHPLETEFYFLGS